MSTTNKQTQGTLTFRGTMDEIHHVSQSIGGTLRFGGSLGLYVEYPVALYNRENLGTLRFSGSLGSVKIPGIGYQSNAGTLTFSGSIQKQTYKGLGGTLSFIGDTDVSGTARLGGTLSFSGALGKETNSALGGTLQFSGDVQILGRLFGTLTFGGNLVSAATYPHNLGGTLSFSGALVVPNKQQELGGRLSFMKVLSTTPLYYTVNDASEINLASQYDFLIEQGVTFTRKFRWIKEDGIPFDLGQFEIIMSIRPYPGSTDIYAASPTDITITKSSTERGVFTISISAIKTSTFSFMRAVYDIVVRWRKTKRTRLIEGDVRLSKGVSIYVQTPLALGGTLTFSGGLNSQLAKILGGTVSFSGSVARQQDLYRSYGGTLTFRGNLNLNSPQAVGGTLTFSGATVAEKTKEENFQELTGILQFWGDGRDG